MPQALLFAHQLLQLVALGATTAEELIALATWGHGKMKQLIDENRDPTQAEMDELQEKIAAKRRQLHSDVE
jgi:hypothetical protein